MATTSRNIPTIVGRKKEKKQSTESYVTLVMFNRVRLQLVYIILQRPLHKKSSHAVSINIVVPSALCNCRIKLFRTTHQLFTGQTASGQVTKFDNLYRTGLQFLLQLTVIR